MFKKSARRKAALFEIAFVSIFFLTCSFSVSSKIISKVDTPSAPKSTFSFISSKTNSCPQNISQLTTRLLQDIPDYSNRIIKRSNDIHQEAGIDNYIIVAGQPEFEPLNLPQIKYDPTKPESIEQIFFTTLERQYQNQQKIERQTYHWLFVTMADEGWYLVTMFSRFGDANKNTPPAPPIESSDGIIGQAVSLWLRDCRQSWLSF